MPTTGYDVMIVGGGLVGASLACALSGQGLRLASVEAVTFKRRAESSYDDRSLSLAYGSRKIFESLGVWPGIRGAATPIHSIEISQRGRFGRTRLSREDQGLPALGYVIEARILGAAILDRLEALEDLDLFCPARVEGLSMSPAAVSLSLETEGGRREISGSLVVAADGAGSRVRELLGISARTTDYHQSAIIANVTPERPHDNRAFERFCDSGPMGLLPLPRGRCGVVWTAREDEVEEILAWPDAQFTEQLQERFGYPLGRFKRVGRRAAFPLQLVLAREDVRPRAVVVGNAAHSLHPVAGQGFNVGLRDVATLAEVVVDAWRDERDIGSLKVLERYTRWRQRDQRGTTLLTDGLVRVFSNGFAPLAALRSAGLVGLDLLPFARRAMTRRTTGLSGHLPRLTRGVPL